VFANWRTLNALRHCYGKQSTNKYPNYRALIFIICGKESRRVGEQIYEVGRVNGETKK